MRFREQELFPVYDLHFKALVTVLEWEGRDVRSLHPRSWATPCCQPEIFVQGRIVRVAERIGRECSIREGVHPFVVGT